MNSNPAPILKNWSFRLAGKNHDFVVDEKVISAIFEGLTKTKKKYVDFDKPHFYLVGQNVNGEEDSIEMSTNIVRISYTTPGALRVTTKRYAEYNIAISDMDKAYAKLIKK